jgi:tRNA nucleotidyltransferase (CCA-adding enzyme)
VVLIFPDGFKVDVATARIEYYESPAALPNVEESSLKMDLYRRDFTINTLAIKLNKNEFGKLVDYFGAQKDLKEKIVRVLHNLSFVEDPTRVLRAIRFEQRFGFKIEKLTLSLIKNAVNINCFKALSGRRFFLELKLLLMEHEPLLAIERLNEFDLLQFVSPEIKFTKEKRELLEEVKAVISWFDHLYLEEPYEPWKVYWHGLTSNLNPKTLQEVTERMQLTDQEGLKTLAQRAAVDETLEKLYKFNGSDHYALFKLLSQFDTDILLYMMAKAKNKFCKRYISIYFTRLKNTRCFLKGRDLKKLGFQPGILYKQIFESVLAARLNQVINTKEDEIQFIKEKFGDVLEAHA